MAVDPYQPPPDLAGMWQGVAQGLQKKADENQPISDAQSAYLEGLGYDSGGRKSKKPEAHPHMKEVMDAFHSGAMDPTEAATRIKALHHFAAQQSGPTGDAEMAGQPRQPPPSFMPQTPPSQMGLGMRGGPMADMTPAESPQGLAEPARMTQGEFAQLMPQLTNLETQRRAQDAASTYKLTAQQQQDALLAKIAGQRENASAREEGLNRRADQTNTTRVSEGGANRNSREGMNAATNSAGIKRAEISAGASKYSADTKATTAASKPSAAAAKNTPQARKEFLLKEIGKAVNNPMSMASPDSKAHLQKLHSDLVDVEEELKNSKTTSHTTDSLNALFK